MSDDAGGYEALAGSAIKTAASVDSLSAKENLESANAGIAVPLTPLAMLLRTDCSSAIAR